MILPALARYQKLARERPGEPVMWAEYGNAAPGAGQVELADRCWQQALGLAPRNAELIGMIGHSTKACAAGKGGRLLRSSRRRRASWLNPRISLAVLLESTTGSRKPGRR